MASKKGRPKINNNNNIIINNINIKYLLTKSDKCDNEVSYVKMLDPKNKLKAVLDTQVNDKDVQLSHIWITDTQDMILKVKSKWLNICDDLQSVANYVMNADFSYYSMEAENGTIKGYYIKVTKIKIKKINFTVDINDDNSYFSN